jgi:hypothetical protein
MFMSQWQVLYITIMTTSSCHEVYWSRHCKCGDKYRFCDKGSLYRCRGDNPTQILVLGTGTYQVYSTVQEIYTYCSSLMWKYLRFSELLPNKHGYPRDINKFLTTVIVHLYFKIHTNFHGGAGSWLMIRYLAALDRHQVKDCFILLVFSFREKVIWHQGPGKFDWALRTIVSYTNFQTENIKKSYYHHFWGDSAFFIRVYSTCFFFNLDIFKGTLTRDFRPLVFFIKQLPLGPWDTG